MDFAKLERGDKRAENCSLRYAYHELLMDCSECHKEFYALPFYVCTDEGKTLCMDCAKQKQIVLTDVIEAYNTDIGLKMAECDSNNGQTFQIAVGMKRDVVFTLEELDALSEKVLEWADENEIGSVWFVRDRRESIQCGGRITNESSKPWSAQAEEVAAQFPSIETLNMKKT